MGVDAVDRAVCERVYSCLFSASLRLAGSTIELVHALRVVHCRPLWLSGVRAFLVARASRIRRVARPALAAVVDAESAPFAVVPMANAALNVADAEPCIAALVGHSVSPRGVDLGGVVVPPFPHYRRASEPARLHSAIIRLSSPSCGGLSFRPCCPIAAMTLAASLRAAALRSFWPLLSPPFAWIRGKATPALCRMSRWVWRSFGAVSREHRRKLSQTHPTPVSYTHLTLPTIYSV